MSNTRLDALEQDMETVKAILAKRLSIPFVHPDQENVVEGDNAADLPEELAELTVDELRHAAQRYEIDGRSTMSKDELVTALAAHKAANPAA